MSKTNIHWSTGNTKVGKLKHKYKKIVTFDIPAWKSADGTVTCLGAKACINGCFARFGFFRMPHKAALMEHNLKLVQGSPSRFVKMAIEDLKRLKPNLVRLHASGDFTSQAIVNAWFKIARQFPNTRFYCYSKVFNIFDLKTNRPDNFSVTQSFGGIDDDKIDLLESHSRIFTSDYARRKAGYAQGSLTDELATEAQPGTKIGLIFHGVKKLSDAQKKYFDGKPDEALTGK